MATPRVMVTGGRGFLGRHLLPILSAQGCELVVVSQNSDEAVDGVRCVKTDLFDTAAVTRLLETEAPDTLIHLAWCTDHGNFWNTRDNLRWVSASLHLAEAFLAAGGQRFIGAGSCAEYNWQQERALEESATARPTTLYGICKRATAEILQQAFAATGSEFFWGRIFFIYGEGEGENKLVSSAIRAFSEGEEFSCRFPDLRRDYIHAADVARGFALMVTAGQPGIYNLGSGEAPRLAEVIQCVADNFTQANFSDNRQASTPDDQPACIVADMSRAKQQLGFKTGLDLQQGIQQQINQQLAVSNV